MPLVQTGSRCTHCHKSPQEADSSIRKCSKCGLVAYCSVACQSAGWKGGHKDECGNPEELEMGSRRAVARSRFGNLQERDEESTIYYLKVARPWISDICISGPYRSIEETYPNIASNLRFSQSGMLYFDQLVKEGMINSFWHIRAPLDADKERVIFIEFIRKDDSHLKAQLPAPVYTVVCGELADNPLAKGLVPLETLDLVGSFTSDDEAEAAAKAELEIQASEFPNSRTVFQREGNFGGAVIAQGKIKRFLQVMYDSGEMDHTFRYQEAL